MADNQSRPPRGNWNISQRNARGAGLYALALINLSSFGGAVPDAVQYANGSQLSITDISFAEFAFNVNPKSLSMSEPAATVIRPTQDGQFIESQGQIYKNVTITGTTGLRPNYFTQGAIIPMNAISNPAGTFTPDPQTGLPQGERTGFDDFIALRNLFRLYWDLKRDLTRASQTIMVWQNGKEGEYYVVEPQDIRTDRDASSPLTFSYAIPLRTIEKLDIQRLMPVNDSYANRNGYNTFFQRISDIKRTLTAAFVTAQAFVDRTANVAQATVNSVLTPVNDVLRALTGIVTSGRRFFDIPQNSLSTVAQSSVDLAVAIDNIPGNSYIAQGIATQATIAANAYKVIARQLRALANEPLLFSTAIASTVSTKQAAYRNDVTGLPRSGGSPTYLGNTIIPNAAAVDVVHVGEDIRAVAQRLLGDAAQWKILTLLNKLTFPYISTGGNGVNVLRPGDQILWPRQTANGATAVSPTTQKYTGESPLSQRLGRDILLRSTNGAAGTPTYGIVVSSKGDIATVEGIPNMEQAINIKMNVEQGELPTHPTFGFRFPLGAKMRLQSLIATQISARATLLSDSRIGDVTNLVVRGEGNTVFLKGNAHIKGFNNTLILDLSVQR